MKTINEVYYTKEDIIFLAESFKLNKRAVKCEFDYKKMKAVFYLISSNGLMYFVDVVDFKVVDLEPVFEKLSYQQLFSRFGEAARDISTLFE